MSTRFQGFRSLVENSPDAISLLNKQGEILYGSPATTNLFGYRPDEIVGKDYLDLIHPEDRDRSSGLLQNVVTSPAGPRSWDARILRKDGASRWTESTASNLIQDLEVQAIVMHQRDVHDRIEAQERSRRQAEELTLSKLRMEEFAYTAAHDLREPLRAISLYTQILLNSIQMDADAKQMAEFVIDGTSRMSRMVTDLLTFARTGMQQPPSVFNLEDAVAQARQNLALEIQESGVTLTVKDLPTICSDEAHLVRVFQNLLSNALKYRAEEPLQVLIFAEPLGPDWVIKVKDNGLGIEERYQSRIFMPFIRLANHSVPGTGLGLAVCKKVVEGLGGTIWMESELGIGSTFAFTVISNLEIPNSVT